MPRDGHVPVASSFPPNHDVLFADAIRPRAVLGRLFEARLLHSRVGNGSACGRVSFHFAPKLELEHDDSSALAMSGKGAFNLDRRRHPASIVRVCGRVSFHFTPSPPELVLQA